MDEWDYWLIETQHGTGKIVDLDTAMFVLRSAGPGPFILGREPKDRPGKMEFIDLNWEKPSDDG